MRELPISPVWLLAGAAVGAALLWVAARGSTSTGQTIGTAVVDLADGVVTGGVVAIGERVGIPKTNMTECEKAKAEGRTWDASFACPAADFIRYLWD